MCDIPFLDIREVIIPGGSHIITVNFFHHRFEGQLAFSVSLKLHFTDGCEIYTDIKIEESKDIVVSGAVKTRLQEQLDDIFASYFLGLTGGNRHGKL